jgi:hypothetical protein
MATQYVTIKVMQSHYRPEGAQRVPGSSGSQISWQRRRMVVGCQPYAPAAFNPRKSSWYSFLLESESTPRPWKIPMTPAGIETATFRFVAQHLNHCATPVPHAVRSCQTSQIQYICILLWVFNIVYLNACKWSVLHKHAACADGTDKIWYVKWNTNLMQHCAGFISARSLYMFRAQAPIIRSIKN